jgi:lipopolysaccharide/colanic/teichoic acid biosynthesis glycosyltransferase
MNKIAAYSVPRQSFVNSLLPRLLVASRDFAKRLLDIIASSVGIVLLLPFFAFVAIRIKQDSPGPVFYRGVRSGKNGNKFYILKFRTMNESAESYRGPCVTAQDDPRITPLGRRLRDTKLNELPQLWNVLKGEMSLVGPRPEDPEIVAQWSEDVRREVLSVRPGITSPASVLHRNEETMLHSSTVMQTYFDSILPNKLRLDQLYVRHHSFLLDLDVLFWTGLVLLPLLRSFALPEDLLIFGPLRRLAQRYLNWFVVDTVITLGAIGLAGLIARSFGPLELGFPKAFVVALGFSLIFGITSTVLGMYRVAWSQAGSGEMFGLFVATVIACGIALVGNQLINVPFLLPPGVIALASAFAFAGFVVARYRNHWIGALMLRWSQGRSGARLARERVLIVGSGYAGQFTAWLLSHGPSAGAFDTVGFVDDDLYKQGARIAGLSVLGRRTDIRGLVEKHDIGILVFAIHNINAIERRRLLEICASTKAQIVETPDILASLNEIRVANGNHQK